MKISSKEEVKKLLSGDAVPNLWVFAGSEEYQKNKLANLVTAHFVNEEMRGTDYAEYDANFFDADELADHLDFFPFVGQHRVAYIKAFSPTAQSGDQLERLLDAIGSLAPTAVLIVTISPVKPTESGDAESKKLAAKFLPACDKAGVVVTPAALQPQDMASFILREAGKWNAKIERKTASQLAERCDNDLLRISNEIQKLASAAMDGEITPALVEKLIPVEVEESVFRIADLILAGNSPAALRQLSDMLDTGDPFMIWGALLYSFTELGKAAAAEEKGVTPAAAAVAYGGYAGKKSFVIEKNMRAAARLRKGYALDCLRILLDCDSQLKSTTGVRPEHLMLQAIAKICALKRN